MITRRVDRTDSLAGFTYEWVRAFAERVDELHVICLEMGDVAGLPKNCHVHSLGKEHGKNRWREFWRFHSHARKLVPIVDGVFSHQNPEYGILIAPWCKMYRRKLIAWYTHKSVTAKLRLLNFLADTMVTASKESFRLVSTKLHVLHHGIDTKHFSLSSDRPRRGAHLLSVSRISPSKNIDLMLELLSALHERGLGDATLTVTGGPAGRGGAAYVGQLKKAVESKALSQSVTFAGPVPYEEIASLYSKASLFLNFSDTGSLDKAVLEAMSSGTPVLVTNEAFRDMLTNIDARLFSTKELGELTVKAMHLLEHPDDRISSAERLHVVENHGLVDLVNKIIREFAT